MSIQRRMPVQSRAKATCDAILTAAARVLEDHGDAAFTTNRVADRAGVSIGSLYQYYPNKESILVALAERAERDLPSRETLNQASRMEQVSPLRLGIRNYIGLLPDSPIARSHALEAVVSHRGVEGVARETDQRFEDSGLFGGLSANERFVLSRAITGVVQAAVREGHRDLKSRSFEDALVALARGFLQR